MEGKRGQETVPSLLCSVLLGDDPCKLHFPGSHYQLDASSWLQPDAGGRLEGWKGKVRVFLLFPLPHAELLAVIVSPMSPNPQTGLPWSQFLMGDPSL